MIDLPLAVEESYRLLTHDPLSGMEIEGEPGDVMIVRRLLALLGRTRIPRDRHGTLLVAWVQLLCCERWSRMVLWCYSDRGILDGEMVRVIFHREGVPRRLWDRILSRASELFNGISQ